MLGLLTALRAAARIESHLHFLASWLDHAQSGWLCALVTGVDVTRLRETSPIRCCQGKELGVGFTVVDVTQPILKFIQTGKESLRRVDGATIELTRRRGLFILQCHVAVLMLLAAVDD